MAQSTLRPPAQPRSFDRTLSYRLDALILAIESAPSWNKRSWLRFQKRLLELRVPKAGAR